MGNGVNTNIEALHEIKDSLVRFQERIAPLQSELTQAFQEIDEQLSQSVKLKMRQLEERQRRGTNEQTPSLAIPALEKSDFSFAVTLHIAENRDVTEHCTESIQTAPILQNSVEKT